MNKPPYLLALGGALALAGAVLLPRESSGQAAAAADDPAMTKLLVELVAQQTVIAENHAKIDEKLALIAEDVRIARIFVGRGGGKAK